MSHQLQIFWPLYLTKKRSLFPLQNMYSVIPDPYLLSLSSIPFIKQNIKTVRKIFDEKKALYLEVVINHYFKKNSFSGMSPKMGLNLGDLQIFNSQSTYTFVYVSASTEWKKWFMQSPQNSRHCLGLSGIFFPMQSSSVITLTPRPGPQPSVPTGHMLLPNSLSPLS